MTIITTQSRVTYAGDGISTNFPIPFEFFLSSDITAVKTAVGGAVTTLVQTVDYNLSGAGTPSGGTAIKTTALLIGETLAFFLNPPIEQESHYPANNPFPASTLENDLDRQTQISQRLSDLISRALRAPDADPTASIAGFVLPSYIARANKFLTFDSIGNPALAVTLPGGTLSLASITALTGAQIAAEASASVTPTNLAYPPGHPWRYGAIDDGTTNCNTALQNWIKVGQQGIPLVLAPVLCGGGYLITAALSITVGVNIQGGGWERSALLCVGCDAFQIAAGVAQVIMQNFRMNLTVRYQQPNGTVTPNAFAGIRVLGSTGNQNTEHLYRDLFIDGFGTYIVGGGLQFSLIDNCQGYFGLQGIILTGIAADVTIRGGIYQCGNLSPSAGMLALQPSGVQIGGGGAGDDSQGCEVLGATITGFFADVWLLGAAFCSVLDSQLDFANGYNVLSQSGVLASCCHNIGNNYMAITANGIHGIRLLNNVVTSFTGGSRIHGNVMIQYAAGASRGIRVDGTQEQSNIIIGNTVNVGSVADLEIITDAGAASHVVTGNNFQGLGSNITVPCTYVGNKGAYVTAPTTFVLTPLYSAVQAALAYSASMTPDFKTNNSLLIIVTNASAFTINNAINPPAAGGLKARIWILNASGGAIGAVTWGSAFRVPAGISYPANGFRRCYEFELLGAGGNYYLVISPTVDIPN